MTQGTQEVIVYCRPFEKDFYDFCADYPNVVLGFVGVLIFIPILFWIGSNIEEKRWFRGLKRYR